MVNGFNNGGALSPAQKAAETRRANRAAGIPPKTRTTTAPRPTPPPPVAPRPTSRTVLATYKVQPTSAHVLTLAALAAFEVAAKAKLADDRKAGRLAADAAAQFDRYQKLKAHALTTPVNEETRIEAQSALRLSLISIIKLIF